MPNKLPQTFQQMTEQEEERRSSRLYRAETAAFADEQLSHLAALTGSELAAIADTPEKIPLSDLKALQKQTVLYCKACEQSSSIPTFSGLARACGVSTEALNYHMRHNPDSPTTEWLRVVHDAFADHMATAALRGLVNNITAIFTLKARSNWVEQQSIVLETANNSPIGKAQTQQELAERYEFLFDEQEDDAN